MNGSALTRLSRRVSIVAAVAVTGSLLMAAARSQAAMVASDSAANYSATSGAINLWPNGTSTFNGGSGFGAWTYNNQAPGGAYAGEYLAIPSYTWPTSESIASGGGYIWGLYSGGQSAGNIPSAATYRALENSAGTGLGTLRSGQTINLAMAVRTNSNPLGIGTTGEGSTPASIGMELLTVGSTANTPIFSLNFSELPANTGANTTSNTALVTTITNAGGTTSYVQGVASNALSINGLIGGVNLSFNLGNGSNYTLDIAPATGNTALTSTLSYTGTVSGLINQVGFLDQMSADDALFNNLAVANSAATPEPASWAFLATVLGGSLVLRRRATRASVR